MTDLVITPYIIRVRKIMKNIKKGDNGLYIQEEEIRELLRSVKHVPDSKTEGKRKESVPARVRIIVLSLSAVILLIIGIILIVNAHNKTKPLIGRWSYDDATVYEFGEDGQGSLILPLNSYSFSYKEDNGTLIIDFSDDMAEDKNYTYQVSGDTLLLIGNDGSEYQFVRKDSE